MNKIQYILFTVFVSLQIISVPYCIEFLHPVKAEPRPKVAVQLNKKSEYQHKLEMIKKFVEEKNIKLK